MVAAAAAPAIQAVLEGGLGHPGRLGQGLLEQGRPEAAELTRRFLEGRGQRDDDQQRGQAEPAEAARATATTTGGVARATSCTSPTRNAASSTHPVDQLEQVGPTPTMVFLAPTARARQPRNTAAATTSRSTSTGDRC